MKNQFESIVKDISLKGLGIIDHPSGKIFFVRGVWLGDLGVFEVEREEKKYGFAKLIQILKPSTYRKKAECSLLGFDSQSCGGCPWMIASYSSQLDVKQSLVESSLSRAGFDLHKINIFKIKGSSEELGYRNRARVRFEKNRLGYYSPETHHLVDVNDCIILNQKTREQFLNLRTSIFKNPQNSAAFYDLSSHVEPSYMLQPNVSLPFQQANDEQNQYMKSWVAQQTDFMNSEGGLIELFCGAGNFTQELSKGSFSTIYAIEGSLEAIENLKSLRLKNVSGYAVNLYLKKNWNQFLKHTKNAKNLFLDPPREGFDLLSEFLNEHKKIQSILYVSCDLHSFVRDAKAAQKMGFHLEKVQPVDQFPQTPHIEILSFFRK